MQVKVRLIVDVETQTVTDADKATTSPLSWPALLTQLTSTPSPARAVLIDCTRSEEVLRQYRTWLAAGVRLVTQRQVQSPLAALNSLPVFSTLYDLQQRQEVITRVEAILPCALSFAFTAPASVTRLTPRAIRDSHEAAKRMVRALAFALGHDVKEADVRCDMAFAGLETAEEVERAVGEFRLSAPSGMVYQYVASLQLGVDGGSGCVVEVGMRPCPACHPFGWLKGYNSSVMVYTKKFPADALVIQGPVAGWSEGTGPKEVDEGVEREKARERETTGLSEEVQHALGQFRAIVSDLAK